MLLNFLPLILVIEYIIKHSIRWYLSNWYLTSDDLKVLVFPVPPLVCREESNKQQLTCVSKWAMHAVGLAGIPTSLNAAAESLKLHHLGATIAQRHAMDHKWGYLLHHFLLYLSSVEIITAVFECRMATNDFFYSLLWNDIALWESSPVASSSSSEHFCITLLCICHICFLVPLHHHQWFFHPHHNQQFYHC